MTWLSDGVIKHLREVTDTPDLQGMKYRIIRRLARGGMGTVFLAEDVQLDRQVAMKVLDLPDHTGELAARMLREARIVARLEHPGIVPIHDVGSLADGRVFYVMKLVQGSRLDEYARSVTRLPDILRIFQKACEAVAFAHAHGVIHRDLKPENVMVGAFGEVLVMDWGLAKVLRSVNGEDSVGESNQMAQDGELRIPTHVYATLAGGETQHGTVMGTPAYMAPEQALGKTMSVDERTDVYALGAMLYFLLTGQPPFAGEKMNPSMENVEAAIPIPPRQLNNNIPRQIEAVCIKAMSPAATNRYGSAQELAAEVARFVDGLAVSAYRENIFERAGRWIGRNRFLVLLIVTYMIMRILMLLISNR